MTKTHRSRGFHGASNDPTMTCTGIARMAPKTSTAKSFPINIAQVYLT